MPVYRFLAPVIAVDRPLRIPLLQQRERRPGGSGEEHIVIVDREWDFSNGLEERRAPWAEVVSRIRSAHRNSILISLTSHGGPSAGYWAIARCLYAHPCRVRIEITGTCRSSGCLIALAGEERAMERDATVLVHRPCIMLSEAEWHDAQRRPRAYRQQMVRSLEQEEDIGVSFIASRTGKSPSIVRQWMIDNRVWDAEESVRNGFATEIC